MTSLSKQEIVKLTKVVIKEVLAEEKLKKEREHQEYLEKVIEKINTIPKETFIDIDENLELISLSLSFPYGVPNEVENHFEELYKDHITDLNEKLQELLKPAKEFVKEHVQRDGSIEIHKNLSKLLKKQKH